MRFSPFDRRQFLASGAALAASPLVSWSQEPKKTPPSEKISLGFIGMGVMGRGHLGSFLGMNDVQVVAVCDVVKERRDDAQKQVNDRYSKDKKADVKVCEAYSDFRKLLERKDIDAVVIATPDHWHAIPCILAARAQKHIYCEKPLTHNIAEGRFLVQEVEKAKVIFQVGSQQRSEYANHFRRAVEAVRNGRIGKITTINIGVGGPAKPCDLKDEVAPEGTDWDFWLGPAPERAYNEILCPKGVHRHFPQWRAYSEYAGGGLADMGAHHFDIAQWALDSDGSGPVEIIPPEKGQAGLKFIYANGVVMVHGGSVDCEFIGEKGKIQAARGYLKADPMDVIKDGMGSRVERVGFGWHRGKVQSQ